MKTKTILILILIMAVVAYLWFNRKKAIPASVIPDDGDLEDQIRAKMNYIINDPSAADWKALIQQKAAQYNIPFMEQLRLDVIWAIKNS